MNEKRVIRIDPTPPKFYDENNEFINKRKRVCAYARVSTDTKDQIHSYNAQIKEYTKRIKRNEVWDFVDMYADEGMSGTSYKKRTGFLRMLEDAKAGKIDLILTKSLSRFARNTVDTLSVIQELRSINVEVMFEKENLSSKDNKVDLMLTIFSSIAQEESRNISENVKWGIRKRYQEGKVNINTGRLLGFDKDTNKKVIINKKQARTVKIIFNLYLAGSSYHDICRYLIENKKKNGLGEVRWKPANIMKILKNEKYCGDVLLQKFVTIDYLTHKSVKNTGQAPQYYIENNHPAIIKKELFNLVQLLIKDRKQNAKGSHYGKRYPLSGLVVCGECKRVLHRNYYNYGYPNQRIVLTCKNSKQAKVDCSHKPLDNETVEQATSDVLNKLNNTNSSIIPELIKTIEDNFDSSHIYKQTEALKQNILKIENDIRDLIKLRASNESNYNEQYLVQAFDEKKALIESQKQEIDQLNTQLVSNHNNLKRNMELQSFLRNNVVLSRNALTSVIKNIIQINKNEVIFCTSTIDLSNKDVGTHVEDFKKYMPILEGFVFNPNTEQTLTYKVIEYGDEIYGTN